MRRTQHLPECRAADIPVHGLWPEYENGGYPERCAPASPVSNDIVTRTQPYIPDAGLIQHEWRDHGTCSGLDPGAFFDLVKQAFLSVQIPPDLKALDHQIQIAPQLIAVGKPALIRRAGRRQDAGVKLLLPHKLA